ncbi:V-type ATP synthase subunit C [Clostridium vincentii]|uniref:V-type sodium ATPase subunit C n=1 Tax=Clostridium vincentii TaxID=52704 RepID=A0A2T0BHL1_9CLOT|nr:V-type ATP synthase subunit C [Clostridium vincentii]PRR83380.1 V-type sodium ATPase subunit C [Clostridium vincentii]
MDVMEFTQVIPRIRVLETRLLDKAKIDRMIDSNSAQEALKVLQETEYANVMINVKKTEDYEEMLSAELKRVYHEAYDMSPLKSLVDIMSIKYDYHNIKVMLKGMFLKKDFSYMLIPVGMIEVSKLKLSIDTNSLTDFNPIMRKGIEVAIDDFNAKGDPQRIDIILDKAMFEEMVEIAKKLEDDFTRKYVEVLIDLTNIKSLLRVKKQNKGREFFLTLVINGGSIDNDKLVTLLNDAVENVSSKLSYTNYAEVLKQGIDQYVVSGSASLLEKLIDNYIMGMMKNAKMITSGGEPLLAYIYAKETEIKVVRIIMVGKLNNITEEVIRERLRDIYV